MKKKITSAVTAGGALLASAPAFAAYDLSSFSFDLGPIEQIVPIILGGLAAIWVGRKLIKLTGKS